MLEEAARRKKREEEARMEESLFFSIAFWQKGLHIFIRYESNMLDSIYCGELDFDRDAWWLVNVFRCMYLEFVRIKDKKKKRRKFVIF